MIILNRVVLTFFIPVLMMAMLLLCAFALIFVMVMMFMTFLLRNTTIVWNGNGNCIRNFMIVITIKISTVVYELIGLFILLFILLVIFWFRQGFI
jgi:hypothetical protein